MAAETAISITQLQPEERDEWSSFVRSSPLGSPYSLPEYQEAFATAVGGSAVTVLARRGETIVGGISLVERKVPFGRYVAPGLLQYYNGFVLRDYETRYPSQRAARQNHAVAALAAGVLARGYGRLEIRSRSPFVDARPLLASGWAAAPSYSYVVPLDDLDGLWSRVDQNLRRLIERARGSGVEFVVGGDFDAFYDLHVATAGRKTAPIYLPQEVFRAFYETLESKDLCSLFHARGPDGAILASQLVLLGHRVTHTVTAAADASRQSTGSNPFLRWSVFEHLAGRGYAANDLTDASYGPVARFKSQLGGDLVVSLVVRRPTSPVYLAQRAALRAARTARSIAERPRR